jgi:hypothetical protein
MKLVPPRLEVFAALTCSEVVAEVFDVQLDTGRVRGEIGQGHAPFLPDKEGSVSVRGQPDLDLCSSGSSES